MRVVNLKKEGYTVYAGRPGPLGNPFAVGKDGTRRQVINKFKKWFLSDDPTARRMRNYVLRLDEDTVLGCFCKPLKCHCDIIVEYYEGMKKSAEEIREERRKNRPKCPVCRKSCRLVDEEERGLVYNICDECQWSDDL